MDLTGRTLGPYTIEEKLGEGGMGAVYRATHRFLNRIVALKVLPPALAQDPDFAARFRREGQAVAALEHPNIVPIYEAGESEGIFYLAMRFIKGHDLSQHIAKRGLLPPGEVVHLLEQAASALDAAHARGIIHRDIKPGNLMLEGDRLYLTDFGIAKSESADFKTRTGMIIGTPEYMAPEQIQGGTVDQRADVYALGVVAYQMLTGQVPFAAQTPSMVIYRKLSEPVPDLRGVRPDLTPALAMAIQRAMASSAETRYATAGQFVAALRAAAQGRPAATSAGEQTLPLGQPGGAQQHQPQPTPQPGPYQPPQPTQPVVYQPPPQPYPTPQPGGYQQPQPGGYQQPHPTPQPGGYQQPHPTPQPGGYQQPYPTPQPGGYQQPYPTPQPGGYQQPYPGGPGYMPAAPKKSRLQMILAVVGAITLGLVLLCGVLAYIGSGTTSSSRTATPGQVGSSGQQGNPTRRPEATATNPAPTEAALTGASIPADWDSHEDASYGFRMAYPPDWEEIEAPEGTIFAVREENPDQFITNVNVVFTELDREYSLDEYTRANLRYLEQSTEYNYERVEDVSTIDVNGVPATRHVYTANFSGTEVGGIQYYFVQDKAQEQIGYVITCSASLDEFEGEREICDQIMSTFELLP